MDNIHNPHKKVDEDWKSQIEAERSQQENKKQTSDASTDKRDAKDSGETENKGQVSFKDFLSTLAMQAYMAMGEIPDPVTQQKKVSLPQANYMIDLLTVIQSKTKNNLNQEEENLLSTLLYQLRMKYVELNEKPQEKE